MAGRPSSFLGWSSGLLVAWCVFRGAVGGAACPPARSTLTRGLGVGGLGAVDVRPFADKRHGASAEGGARDHALLGVRLGWSSRELLWAARPAALLRLLARSCPGRRVRLAHEVDSSPARSSCSRLLGPCRRFRATSAPRFDCRKCAGTSARGYAVEAGGATPSWRSTLVDG